MIRIIDNKKVKISDDEYAMYLDICKANDRPNFEGKSLFEDLFEVNGDGIIIFVKPPRKKYSSMEVYCFLISIMTNQHIRIMYEQTNMLVKEAQQKFGEVVSKYQKEFEELKINLVEKGEQSESKKKSTKKK